MRARHVLLAISVIGSTTVAHAQRPLPIIDDFAQGMVVTAQGCVRRAEDANAFVFTQVTTWPIAKTAWGQYGPRHFAIRLPAHKLDEYVGDTLQLTGRIIDIQKSEIETEPGLRRFGRFIEFERPDRNVLVRPESAGIDLHGRGKGDIAITLLDYEVDSVMRVMRGCLQSPAWAGATARRR